MANVPPKKAGMGPTPIWKAFVWVALRAPLERLRWQPLWLVVACLVAAILYGFGSGFGVPELFWHHKAWTQFFAGVGVGVLFCELCFVSFLLDSDEQWLEELFPGDDPNELPKYLHSLLWPLFLATVLPAALMDIERRWSLLAGAVAGIAVSLAVGYLLRRISMRLQQTGSLDWIQWVLFNPPDDDAAGRQRTRRMRWLFTRVQKKDMQAPPWLYFMAAGYFFTVVAAYFVLRHFSDVVSPALAICVLLGLFVRVYGLLVFHFEGLYYFVVVVVIGWILWVNSVTDDKHRIAGLSYDSRVPLGPLLNATANGSTESPAMGGGRADKSRRLTTAAAEIDEFPRLDDTLVLLWRQPRRTLAAKARQLVEAVRQPVRRRADSNSRS